MMTNMDQPFNMPDFEDDLRKQRINLSRRKRKIQTIVMGILAFVICALIFVTYAHVDSLPGFIAALLALAGMVFLQFTLPKIIADALLPD